MCSKTENQINLLSKKKVSLRGKAIILNSFVLSKAQFLSNLFLIPKQLEKQLHKLIFKYTGFYENIKPISRKTIYPPKERGGLGMLHPNFHNIAMKIKHYESKRPRKLIYMDSPNKVLHFPKTL